MKWIWTAGLVLLVSMGAEARESPFESALDDAKELARKHEPEAAAKRFGEAIALAQKSGGLDDEDDAATAFIDFVGRLSRVPSRPETRDATSDTREFLLGDGLAEAMQRLDATRCGSFVSAPALARDVLLLATETGRRDDVADAVKVTLAAAKKPSTGKAFAVTARYAEGMRLLDDAKFEEAEVPLRAVVEEAGPAGWTDLVTHAATELAYAHWKQDEGDAASQAFADAASFCDATTPTEELLGWKRCIDARLAGAPTELLAAARAALDALHAGSTVAPGAAGRGGDGRNAGEAEPRSEVAKLVEKLRKGGAIVTVARTASGYEIRWPWRSGKPQTEPNQMGDHHVQDGGLTLTLSDRRVALRMFDPRGLDGAPGSSPQRTIGRAFYLLAEGETWTVTREGVVKIGK